MATPARPTVGPSERTRVERARRRTAARNPRALARLPGVLALGLASVPCLGTYECPVDGCGPVPAEEGATGRGPFVFLAGVAIAAGATPTPLAATIGTVPR